jgi:glycosyltransferase involved in cell wall biosynthesis
MTSNGCGVAVRPDDPRDFADKVQQLAASPQDLARMGVAARALAEREFSRDRLAADVLRVLENAVRASRGAAGSSVLVNPTPRAAEAE